MTGPRPLAGYRKVSKLGVLQRHRASRTSVDDEGKGRLSGTPRPLASLLSGLSKLGRLVKEQACGQADQPGVEV